jgi:hypothetical protein
VRLAITTLRLATNTTVWWPIVLGTVQDILLPVSHVFLAPNGAWMPPPKNVHATTEDEIQKMFHALSNYEGKAGLAIARWNNALERPNAQDRLIDLWILLESLFTGDSKTELRYRASLRIAAFLGGNHAERVSVFKVIRDSYDLRSKLVHGVAEPHMTQEEEQLVALTQEYSRRALVEVIRRGGIRVDTLDEIILNGSFATSER